MYEFISEMCLEDDSIIRKDIIQTNLAKLIT
jgi:hypothetical protein